MIKLIIALIFSLTVGGCSSIAYTISTKGGLCGMVSGGGDDCGDEKRKMFIGTRKNVEAIKETEWPEKLLFLIDTPLSAVLDVIFLVYTVPRDLIAN